MRMTANASRNTNHRVALLDGSHSSHVTSAVSADHLLFQLSFWK